MKTTTGLGLVSALLCSAPLQASEPPVLLLRHDSATINYRVSVNPGVPRPGRGFAVEVELSRTLETPDPLYGTQRPLEDAEVTLVLVAPRGAVQHHRAMPLADSGTFAATFTASDEGLFSLFVRGSAEMTSEFAHGWPISVGVWPPPEAPAVARLPERLPAAAEGNLEHGRALCEQHCRTGVEGAKPETGAPRFLLSAVAAALSDAELVDAFIDRDRLHRLTALDRNDLVHYLRSLHLGVEALFPEAGHYLARRFTINDYGLERLQATAGIRLKDEARSGVVFVAYRKKSELPRLVDYDDRIARDILEPADRLGYVIFFDRPRDEGMREMAFALGREPTYPIARILARNRSGRLNRRLNAKLEVFTGQGAFNDANSLERGPRALRKQVLPLYLVAAELATMYYGAEREFTAFDDELN